MAARNLGVAYSLKHDIFQSVRRMSRGDKIMAVHSTFFGVTKLTGEDSDKFRRQVTFGRPSQAAVESLQRGQALLRAMDSKGYVKIKAAKSK